MEDLILKFALQNAVRHKGKCQAKAIFSKVLGEEPKLKENIKELQQKIKEITDKVNSMSLEEQEKQLKLIAPELLEKKEVIQKPALPELELGKETFKVRFEPSPSGPMHIGHTYPLSLNSELAKKYFGSLIIRIGDTNPENIYPPSYELIPEDAAWLTQNNVKEVVVQSSRMEVYYEYIVKLFEMEKAYVCTCEPNKFKDLLQDSKACPCRELPKAEQLKRWKAMLVDFMAGEAVVRIKTDLNHKNPAMRDWPAFRVNEGDHPMQGKKYRVWPLMNFAVAIDDHDMEITHTVRAKDHIDNEKKQKYIYDYFGWEMPQHLYVGRINFEDMKISTSETRVKIDAGEYEGWDDVRLPFLPALKRRGYQPEAFVNYALDVGVTQNDKRVSKEEFFKAINFYNKAIIEEKANRYFFVWEPVEIEIGNAPELNVEMELHPDFPDRGMRKFKTWKKFFVTKEDLESIKEGEEVRLMNCLTFRKEKDKFVFVTKDYSKGLKTIHWLPKGLDAEVLMPDNNLKEGLIEDGAKDLEEDSIVQLERFGFCRLDNKKKLRFWFAHK
jgi:glutamyl-tRNA synthetase